LVVDPDAVLAGAVAPQLLQTVPRRHPEVNQARRGIQHAEFPQRHSLNSRPELPHRPAAKEPFSISIPELLRSKERLPPWSELGRSSSPHRKAWRAGHMRLGRDSFIWPSRCLLVKLFKRGNDIRRAGDIGIGDTIKLPPPP